MPAAAATGRQFDIRIVRVPEAGVSRAVNTLWGQAKAESQLDAQPSKLLDLFRDNAPPLRKSLGGKV